MHRTMYHTQEGREVRLLEPVKCTNDYAWLGAGYYFWYSEEDAHFWGNEAKHATSYYEIYSSEIDCENVLDTVFNEEDYLFWIRQIEKCAKKFFDETKVKPSLKEINTFFREKGVWDDFDGILFQDISSRRERYLVTKFFYKKRIQLVVYDKSIIISFKFESQSKCQ
jgi:hypothetical protein